MTFTYLNLFELSMHISLISLKQFFKKLSANDDSVIFGNSSTNFTTFILKIIVFFKFCSNWNKLSCFFKSPKNVSLVINNPYNVLLLGANYIFVSFNYVSCFFALPHFICLFIKFFFSLSLSINKAGQLLFNIFFTQSSVLCRVIIISFLDLWTKNSS